MKPSSIKVLDKKNLHIEWDDGIDSNIELKTLRKLCPCANCSEQRLSQSDSYIPLYFEDQIKVVEIFEVGNYAIGIKWKDGHNTGIYEFPLLRKISQARNI